jgi:predicted O-methyltransferase YrrM
MIKESLRNAAYAVAPRYVVERYLHHKIVRAARRLSQLRDAGRDSSALMETLWASHFFRPLQKRAEILRLLELVRAARPANICEIGAAGGGTTFLLAQAAASDATVITLDLAFNETRRAAVHSFGLKGQKVFCLQQDSHRPETVQLVRECLEGKSLDVLYLDGDHSYEGIKADFQLYSPLVRHNGLIVFHDIVPDYKTRYGIETTSYVGGVPQFWEELKAARAKTEEIVEDYEQDGYGIGVLHWSGESGSVER